MANSHSTREINLPKSDNLTTRDVYGFTAGETAVADMLATDADLVRIYRHHRAVRDAWLGNEDNDPDIPDDVWEALEETARAFERAFYETPVKSGRGAALKIREWMGWNEDEDNAGQRLDDSLLHAALDDLEHLAGHHD